MRLGKSGNIHIIAVFILELKQISVYNFTAEQLCEKYGADANLQSYILDQTSLSFYLAVSAYAKMVDIFLGWFH
jgi:hypothetical protein